MGRKKTSRTGEQGSATLLSSENEEASHIEVKTLNRKEQKK